MRNLIAAIAFLGLILLLISSVLGGVARQPAPTEVAQPVSVSPRLARPLGVNVALEQYDSQELTNTLDAIAASGFGWIRQRFPWDQIEPQAGQFIWTPWDAIVEAANRSDLALVAVLDGSPTWARRPEDAANPLAPPQQRADFGRFVAAFAARYGDRLRFYQVWDEPNIAPHWGARSVDAADYTGLLREATVQIRAADPDATILLAALAPNVEPGGTNQSDIDYLAALYRAGAAPWFDAAAGQPYGFEQPPNQPPAPNVLNFRRVELLREIMRRHGDRDKALWLVAYGWHAALPGQPEQASPWGSVAEEMQADWAVEALEWARGNWPWTGAVAWAWWQPPQPPADPHWGLALVRQDGSHRPTLDALRNWATQPHPLGPGVWPPDAPALQYEGGWRKTSEAADPPQRGGPGNNRLLIPFEGSSLDLRIQRGPYWAYLTVSVDGQPANGLPRDDRGNAYLILYDPLAAEATVTVADALPDGPHQAEIVANRGWEQWPLRQIIVRREPASRWPGRLLWGVAAIGLSALLALMLAQRWLRERVEHGLKALVLLLPATMIVLVRPWWMRYAALAILVAAVGLASGALQIAAVALIWALMVTYYELAPFLLGVVTPLFLVPVSLAGRGINPVELTAWLGVTALLINYIVVRASISMGIVGPDEEKLRSDNTTRVLAGFTWLDGGLVALLLISALSLLAADNFGVALHEFRTVIVTGILAYGLVRLALPPTGSGSFRPWSVVWGIGLGAAVVAGWGIYQAVAGVGVIAAEGVVRVRGPYGSPNNLGLYLGHALPILLGVAALGSTRGRRILAALLTIPLAIALLLTFSKGALLLGVPAAVLFLGLAAGGRWRWVAVAVLLLGGLALLPLFRTPRFAGLFDLESGTTFLRLQLWRGAWNMIQDHPWLGVGLDNFLYAYRTTYALPGAWEELNLSHPHNIVLDFWTRLGIPGVAVGAWLFSAAIRRGWQALRHLQGDEHALMLGLLAALIATLAHGLIDNSVFLVDLMVLFALTLGLIAQLDAKSRAGMVRPTDRSPAS